MSEADLSVNSLSDEEDGRLVLESEDEEHPVEKEDESPDEEKGSLILSEDEENGEKAPISSVKKAASAILSDDEENEAPAISGGNKKKASAILSDDEENEAPAISGVNKAILSDDEASSGGVVLSEDEEVSNGGGPNEEGKKDSSSEDEDAPNKSSGAMSEKEASSRLFSIRSSSQRRLRESSVSIPVHVPKKLSLEEFLNRKKTQKDSSIEAIYSKEAKPPPNRRKSLLLQKLGIKGDILESQPKISSQQKHIDLGSVTSGGAAPQGLLDLQGRLAKQLSGSSSSSAPSSLKKDRVISVVSKELKDNGEVEVTESQVSIPDEEKQEDEELIFHSVLKAKKSDVSGAQFRALKATLRSKILENRKKDLVKREEMKKMEEEEVDTTDLLDENFDEDEEVEEEDEGSTESEPEEEPPLTEGKSGPKSMFIEDEAEDEDLEEEESGPLTLEEDSCALDSPPKTNTPFSQLANSSSLRWTPIEDRNNDDEEEAPSSLTQIHARKRLGFEELFDATDPSVDDFGDVVGLCSGQFLERKPKETQDTFIPTQKNEEGSSTNTQDTIPFMDSLDNKNDGEEEDDDDDLEGPKQQRRTQRIVMSDDSSDEEQDDEETPESQSILSRPNEESPIEEEEGPGEVEDVEYDSEENEVPCTLFNKKGLLREDFFEKEAELSGSDAGSEDEDEEGMNDELEMEEGDLDELDHDRVREEVGKIHHHQLLDEDKREIRFFQEAFLEDGDLHTDKSRGRSFRWLNNEEPEELEKRPSDDEDEVEDEKAEKLRLERIEREKWLKNSASLLEESDDENTENNKDEDSQLIQLGAKALKKLQNSSKAPARPNNSSSKLLPLQPMKSQSSKGSFLSRPSDKLSKLNELSKNKGEVREGSGAKAQSRNFVFSTLSPKKSQATKKKLKDSARECPASKKPKIERTLQEGSTNTIFGFL